MSLPEVKNFEFPECWENDIRMNSLYAPFRARTINPTDWDSKMKFWVSLIEKWCVHHKNPILDMPAFLSEFRRKGKVPSCLSDVVEHLYRNKTVVTKDVFSQMLEKSWKNWALQIIFSNPLTWTISKVKSTLVNSQDSNVLYIHLPAVNELGQQLIKKMPEDCKGKLLDSNYILKIAEIKNMEVLQLLLHWLQAQRLVALHQSKLNLLVKFPNKENDILSISDTDKALFSLEQNKRLLESNIEKLEQKKEHFLEEAKKYVAKKNTLMAKSNLRRKKIVENVIAKITDALDNLEKIACEIQMGELNSVVLESYQTGVDTLNKFFKENNFTKEKVLNTKNELEELFILNIDISNALSAPSGNEILDESNEDLENELRNLLAENETGKAGKAGKRKEISADGQDSLIAKLPDVPADSAIVSGCEKLEKRLADLAI